MTRKEVLVITTETPSEGEIEKHLQPVTSHVVAGTNLFSDFFAGMSDIFGGRSGSYKKQLSSIYSEAIDRIKQEAKRIGANGVVGLKIDIDEISGQGKSMFMITAIGTAVIIKYESHSVKSPKKQIEENKGRISINTIVRLKMLKNLLSKAEKKKLKFSNDTWDFIIQNGVKQIYPFVIDALGDIFKTQNNHTPEYVKVFTQNTITYLRSLETEDQRELLYNSLLEEKANEPLVDFILEYIKEDHLFHYHKILELLKSEHLCVQKRGLIASTYDQSYYTSEEENQLRLLANQIPEFFPERGASTTKKQLLSSKEKEAWKCECGKVNNQENIYCVKCYNDIFGFKSNEMTPPSAIKLIDNKISLIEESFQNSN